MDKAGKYFPRLSLSLLVTFIYIIAGLLWIMLSDYFLALLSPAGYLTMFQTFKGTFFIIVTAIILFFLINGYTRKIRDVEERFRKTVEEVKDYAIYILNKDGIISSWNKGAEKLKGYTSDEVIGKHYSIFFHDEDKIAGLPDKQLQIAASNGKFLTEGIRQKKNGSTFYAMITISALKDNKGEINGYLKLVLDITEKKKSEEMLIESREQVRSLIQHLDIIREEERLSISREIHDDLGQLLTSLKIDMSFLSKQQSLDMERIGKMKSKIDAIINTVRRISSGLRPTEIDLLGIDSTIESELSSLRENTSIMTHYDSNLDDKALGNKQTCIAIYRIFKEALTNVVRHSNAQNLFVNLNLDKAGNLLLEIKDDGKGMDISKLSDISYGIIGMKERSAIMGGELDIISSPGNGCHIKLLVPQKRLEHL